MKVQTLTALAVAAISHYAAAKELKPTDEFLDLYQSGTKHREIMALKHVCSSTRVFHHTLS
jgi:hypothetical protein